MCSKKDQNYGITILTVVPCHCICATYSKQQFLMKNIMAVVPHIPYSVDLVPCDFALFPRLKLKMKGQDFDTVEGIKK